MEKVIIPEESYRDIVKLMPILCVDVIIRNNSGKYLLIKRSIEPLLNKWWVIGGRVWKGEKLVNSAQRKVKEETSLTASLLHPIGFYEDFYEKNPFGVSDLYHTLSIVFTTMINDLNNIQLDDQSNDWKLTDRLPQDFVVLPFNQLGFR